MTRTTRSRLRLGIEAVGWLVAVFGCLVAAGEKWPSFGCRVFGHSPSAWMWQTAEQEETSCELCGIALFREREVKSEPEPVSA